MRSLDDVIEDFRARLSTGGESGVDGLCTYFLAREGASRLRACRTSEFAVEMASHGLKAPKVALIEGLDVFLEFRADYLPRLGLEGCDVFVLTRGHELLCDATWWAMTDADASEIRCAFDFTARGLAYFIVARDALGERCRVAWPPGVEAAFLRRREEGGVAPADGSKLTSDNPDALRWARLLVEHGVAVRQRELLA